MQAGYCAMCVILCVCLAGGGGGVEGTAGWAWVLSHITSPCYPQDAWQASTACEQQKLLLRQGQ